MADPSTYTYPSPIAGYENAPPLSMTLNPDGKSFHNTETGRLSAAYERFPEPIDQGQISQGFDAHVYFYRNNPSQVQFAKELWERVRREFPELRIYKIFNEPIGPHTLAMFEVDILTPAQFGAFVPWLVINRGPLNVLLHPNTDDPIRDHTQRATWLGKEVPVDIGLLREFFAKAK